MSPVPHPVCSVIVPTWNRGVLLVEAVKSAIEQTERRIEVLVCDDGSTDNSRSLVESLNDARVHWIEGPRYGRPAPARNRGLALARGDWVAFLDSDDRWAPDKLEKQLLTLASTGFRACSTNAERVVTSSLESNGAFLAYNKSEIELADIVTTNWVICSSMLVDRRLLLEAGGFPEGAEFRAIEDYALWIKLAALTKIAYLPECHVMYRDDPVTSIRSDSQQERGELRKKVFGHFLVWLRSRRERLPLRDVLRIRCLWFQACLGLEPGDRLHLLK